MKYTVTWHPDTQGEATSIWLSTRHRYEVTQAMALIDRSLAVDPVTIGESRAGNLRAAYFEPLLVWFRVATEDRRVDIVGVRYAPPSRLRKS